MWSSPSSPYGSAPPTLGDHRKRSSTTFNIFTMTDLLHWFASLRMKDVDLINLPLEHDNARAPVSGRINTCPALPYRSPVNKKRPRVVPRGCMVPPKVWTSPSIPHGSGNVGSHQPPPSLIQLAHTSVMPRIVDNSSSHHNTQDCNNAPKPQRQLSSKDFSPTISLHGDKNLIMPRRKASVCWEDVCTVGAPSTWEHTDSVTSSVVEPDDE